jgi:Mg-chelatase subunit ChlI
MERNLTFERDAEHFREGWLLKEEELSTQIGKARPLVDRVTYSRRDMLSIASLTASLNVEGHRADLVILKAARAHAAFEGRSEINDHDIAIAAELALPHRIRRGPFQDSEVSMEELAERIDALQGATEGEDAECTSEPAEAAEKSTPPKA